VKLISRQKSAVKVQYAMVMALGLVLVAASDGFRNVDSIGHFLLGFDYVRVVFLIRFGSHMRSRQSSSTPSEQSIQTAEKLLPAVLCSLIGRLLIGGEAGLLHAKASATLGWSQREEHDPLKAAFCSASAPVIGEALERIDDQHLAVDNAIPVGLRILPELKLAPDHRFEVVVHHPLCEERALSERSPQFLRRVREYSLDHKDA
jgi:hypothetical protein